MDFKETQLPRANETDIRSISGLIAASPDAPTGAPRSFHQQFRIVTGVLYYFDTIASAWYAAGNNIVSSAGQLIVNVSGVIQGVAALIWDGSKLSVTGDIEIAHGHTVNSPTDGALVFGQVAGSFVSLVGASPVAAVQGKSVGLFPGQGGTGIDGDIWLYPSSANTSTTRTGAFIIFPTSAGQPTGVPASAAGGFVSLVYDTTNDQLWAYNGGSWKSVTFT